VDGRPGLSLLLANFGDPGPGGWDVLLDRAVAADRAGVERLWVVDHVLLGPDTHEHEGAPFPTGPEADWLEPLTTLAVMAGRTRRVRLATGVLVAALRRPAVLAKAAATLDVLSGGRLELGVGAGWQRAEFAACGIPFAARGRYLDDTLAVCGALWSGEPVTLERGDAALVDVVCRPVPAQPGGIPLWVGGRLNAPAQRRLARWGRGWLPWIDHADDVGTGIAIARRALADAGRDPAGLAVRARVPVVPGAGGGIDVDATLAPVPGLVAAGVTDVNLRPPLPRSVDGATEVLAGLVRAFRARLDR
jgi:probable F420-dependent oxidoreductase